VVGATVPYDNNVVLNQVVIAVLDIDSVGLNIIADQSGTDIAASYAAVIGVIQKDASVCGDVDLDVVCIHVRCIIDVN